MYEVGDVVCVIDDMAEVFRLQKGHGEWADDMALVCNTLVKSIQNLMFGRFGLYLETVKYTKFAPFKNIPLYG